MRDDASELRIAIGRVLERWQLERAGLDPEASEQQRERFELLSRHIEDVKRAVSPAPRIYHLVGCDARDGLQCTHDCDGHRYGLEGAAE